MAIAPGCIDCTMSMHACCSVIVAMDKSLLKSVLLKSVRQTLAQTLATSSLNDQPRCIYVYLLLPGPLFQPSEHFVLSLVRLRSAGEVNPHATSSSCEVSTPNGSPLRSTRIGWVRLACMSAFAYQPVRLCGSHLEGREGG